MIPDDRLLDFWREYQDDQRLSVVAPLEEFDEARIRTSDPSVNAIRYQKGDQEICHVLNYDYREKNDTVVPKRNVEVSLPWSGTGRPPTVRWLSLQGEEFLDCRVDAARLRFTISSVDPYGLAVIE